MDDFNEDLACVFGRAPLRPNVRPRAYHHDQLIDHDTALAQAAALLATAKRSIWVGLHPLSMAALGHVVTLAQHTRGTLAPWPHFDTSLRLTRPITELGTMGHLMGCDMILGAGVNRSALPAKLHKSIRAFEALPGSLEHVLQWREAIQKNQPDNPILRLLAKYHSIGVVLPHDADQRTISQWHRLAGEVQERVRMAVLVLPDPEALNARGVQAIIAWRTGRSLATGSVNFSLGMDQPQQGQPWDAMVPASFDLVIDTTLHGLEYEQPPLPAGVDVIRISSEVSPTATYSFLTPDLSPGLRAQVMRFDGQLLQLTPSDQFAQPDLTALLLGEISQLITMKSAMDQGAS